MARVAKRTPVAELSSSISQSIPEGTPQLVQKTRMLGETYMKIIISFLFLNFPHCAYCLRSTYYKTRY